MEFRVKTMKKRVEEMDKKIKRVEMGMHVVIGKLQYYEMKYYWDNNEGKERCNIVEIPAKPLKDKGVIKRTDSYKKIKEWFNNTEEGREFFLRSLRSKFGKEYVASFV